MGIEKILKIFDEYFYRMKYKFGGPSWINLSVLSSKSFICWNCNHNVASDKGYTTPDYSASKKIFIGPHCSAPNMYDLQGNAPLLNYLEEK